MPFGLGIWEILILAGVLVLLFGSKGAPAMARRLGTGVRELKDAVSDLDPTSMFDTKDDAEKPKPKTPPALGAGPIVDATPAVRVASKPGKAASRDDIITVDEDPPAP